MSVCSGSGIVSDSTSASAESNRQSSTRVACSEKIAKLTPTPSQVAPSGYGVPGQTRKLFFGTGVIRNGSWQASDLKRNTVRYHVHRRNGNEPRLFSAWPCVCSSRHEGEDMNNDNA